MNALIVEDDRLALRAMGLLMRSLGFTVMEAQGVKAGIAQLRHQPEVVLLDLTLPDGDGFRVLCRIRKLKIKANVAVVTGEQDAKRLTQVRSLRPDAIFQKPLVFAAFRDWLAEASVPADTSSPALMAA